MCTYQNMYWYSFVKIVTTAIVMMAGVRAQPSSVTAKGDDRNACTAPRFPCNATTQFCCLYEVPNTKLAWCCEMDDGCGTYPYTCGAMSVLGASANVTVARTNGSTTVDVTTKKRFRVVV